MNRAERVAMVDRSRTDLSVRRQCRLLGLARSGVWRDNQGERRASIKMRRGRSVCDGGRA